MSKSLAYTFRDPALLDVALTHASHAHENQGVKDNERLEFLGDAVLQLSVTNWLVERFPDSREGQLSSLRQRLVNTKTLAALAEHLDLGAKLKLGNGEEVTGGRSRPRVLAGAVEAILGAVFIDAGYEAAELLVREWLHESVEELSNSQGSGWKDPRSMLQEWTQKKLGKTPTYELLGEQGPAHSPVFEVAAYIDGEELGRGAGTSKRDAARLAATAALTLVRSRKKPKPPRKEPAEQAPPPSGGEPGGLP